MGYGKLNEDGTLQSASLQHDGMVSLDLFAKDENGKFYSVYLLTPVAGVYQPDMTALNISAVKSNFAHFHTLAEKHINDAVIAYDKANYTTYRKIESFTKYNHNSSHPRYIVAMDFLDKANLVWDAVVIMRDAYLADTSIVPTDEEFIANLPSMV
jgi:hypothetical protein